MSAFSKLFKTKPQPLDWQKFTEYFAERIRNDLNVQTKILWGEDLDSTVISILAPERTDNPPLTYLGNHYSRYLQEPGELEYIVQACIAVIKQMLDTETEASADQIFPVIKDHVWLENLRLMQEDNGSNLEDSILYRPIAGDIILMYMLDDGATMRSLNRQTMEQAGIHDEETLYRTALDNLRRHMQDNIRTNRADDNSLTQFFLDGNYDASMILQFGEILKDDPVLPANPVFIVPARNVLVACNPADETALAALHIIAREISEEAPYAVSAQLYQFHNGTISLFRSN